MCKIEHELYTLLMLNMYLACHIVLNTEMWSQIYNINVVKNTPFSGNILSSQNVGSVDLLSHFTSIEVQFLDLLVFLCGAGCPGNPCYGVKRA